MAFSKYISIQGCLRASLVNVIGPVSNDYTITDLGIRVRWEGNEIIRGVNGREGRESLVVAVLVTPAGSNDEIAKLRGAPVGPRAVDDKADVCRAAADDLCVDAEHPGAGAVGGTDAMQALDDS